MDYLHYMNFETEAFALIVQPLITFGYFHHYLTTIVFSWTDFYCLIFSFAIRTILLIIFIRVMSANGECIGFGDGNTKAVIGTIVSILEISYLGFFLLNENDTLFS